MATLTMTASNWEDGQIRITYEALNGALKITKIEGRKTDAYRSWVKTFKSITMIVGGTSKTISLGHYVDFPANSTWVSWEAASTSWTGLTGTSISVSTTMPSSSSIESTLEGAKFSGNATMSWDKYTISYNANGGTGAPASQTKTHGTALTLSSTIPTRTGYSFKGWALSKADADNGTWYYQAGGSCGKNEDLTLYATWSENKLTVNYYSNYATSAFDDAENAVGADKNVKVWTGEIYYDNDYTTYGLANYSNSGGSLYMTRTGYTGTGDWGTSTNGGTLINENTGYATGQALAKALGKDLSNGNASINLYAQWSENKLTVNYYSNYATYGTYKGDSLNVSESTNVLVHSQDFYYDNTASAGLSDVQNVDYLYLHRMGYTPTGYWGTSENGGTLVNEKTAYDSGQSLAVVFGKNLENGNASINVYPQWQINTYIISYDTNKGSGDMDSQTVEWKETFQLLDNKFLREGYKLVGWNLNRNDDDAWYVIGQGWLSDEEILTNGYEKKVYENQTELTLDASWVRDNEDARRYTFYAVWKISGVVYIDDGIKFEPYLAYVDNGTDWDLYLTYVDDGINWDIIS